MKKILCLLPLSLGLAGCPMDAMMAPASATSAAAPVSSTGTATPMNVAAFLGKLETARGSALNATEKASVSTAAQQTRGLIDGTQQRFLGAIAQVSGLDTATVGLLFPQAAQPVSQASVITQLEGKLGHKLGGFESQAAKTAATLRNNSLSSLRSGFAGKVGGMVGLDGPTVESLLPLIGL